jgi:hypothetical protein
VLERLMRALPEVDVMIVGSPSALALVNSFKFLTESW